MRTLIYKRTHPGDPDAEGRFGIHDCMGRVRSRDFDAVIGVGGIGAEPISHRLDGKVNWIGIGPSRRDEAGKRGPVVIFKHFLLFPSEGRDGPCFRELAPKLADRMYSRNVRSVMDSLDEQERAEVKKILALAEDAPRSSADGSGSAPSPGSCGRRSRAASVKGCSC